MAQLFNEETVCFETISLDVHLCGRYVLGYRIGYDMATSLVIDTIQMHDHHRFGGLVLCHLITRYLTG